jgi:hypothetical protein
MQDIDWVLREGIKFSLLSKANIFAGLPTYAVVYIVKIKNCNYTPPPPPPPTHTHTKERQGKKITYVFLSIF